VRCPQAPLSQQWWLLVLGLGSDGRACQRDSLLSHAHVAESTLSQAMMRCLRRRGLPATRGASGEEGSGGGTCTRAAVVAAEGEWPLERIQLATRMARSLCCARHSAATTASYVSPCMRPPSDPSCAAPTLTGVRERQRAQCQTPGLRFAARPVESSRASPPHRPREDELGHPADTSRTNLAAALGLLSRWRLSKPRALLPKLSPRQPVAVDGVGAVQHAPINKCRI
jgi:hypothetical protein